MVSAHRRGGFAIATALGVYAISVALVVFGWLENPRTWSFGWNSWLHRNLPFVLNCQDGWSTAAKLVPLALLGAGAGVVSFVPRRRRVRSGGLRRPSRSRSWSSRR